MNDIFTPEFIRKQREITGTASRMDLLDAIDEIERLQNILVKVVEWFELSDINYANGVTYQGIDEGNVRGFEGQSELIKSIISLLPENKVKRLRIITGGN